MRRRDANNAWYLAGGAPMPIAAYQAIGAASLAASKINLVSPGTYDAFAGTNPTHASATGWTFDGTTQYLRTGIVPTAAFACLVRLIDHENTNYTYFFGESTTGAHFAMSGCEHFDYSSWYMGNLLEAIPKTLSGVMGMAGYTAYRNGVAVPGSIPAWTATTTKELYIGGCNGLAAINWPSIVIQAVVLWSTSAGHATWMPAVSAAMAALTG
ncbi:MAG: hypothetical protein WCY09_08675 [Candidatus Omnitrophota bacterium]